MSHPPFSFSDEFSSSPFLAALPKEERQSSEDMIPSSLFARLEKVRRDLSLHQGMVDEERRRLLVEEGMLERVLDRLGALVGEQEVGDE